MNLGLFIILKKISFSILFLITLQLNSYYAKKQFFYWQEVKYATLTKISAPNTDHIDAYDLRIKFCLLVVPMFEQEDKRRSQVCACISYKELHK